MDIILKEIVAIIKEETENINKKIYGTTFLEILKEKILNRQDQISLKNLVLQNSNELHNKKRFRNFYRPNDN